jgi:DNA-directed RNA polymerase specialized sigma24 family protein
MAMETWPMTTTAARTAEQAGTQAEFEAFYLRTARTLHGYLCRLSRDAATADEVLQEAYIRLINVPVMDELPRKAYLYKTATNILRDRWRKPETGESMVGVEQCHGTSPSGFQLVHGYGVCSR